MSAHASAGLYSSPQARIDEHPTGRIAEADGGKEWETVLPDRVKALDSVKEKADFIPSVSQNLDVNTALHVCSYLT